MLHLHSLRLRYGSHRVQHRPVIRTHSPLTFSCDLLSILRTTFLRNISGEDITRALCRSLTFLYLPTEAMPISRSFGPLDTLASRQTSIGTLHVSCIRSQASRRFSIHASSAAPLKKLDLSSSRNDYISLQPGTDKSLKDTPASDLEVYPDFMTPHEQEVLLSAALKKLDSMASREERKKRREWNKANKAATAQSELRSR